MKVPLYKKIYKTLQHDILNEVYQPGDKLPSDEELANKFNVSKITITSAMNQLKEDGLISRAPRRGSYVIEKSEKVTTSLSEKKPQIGLLVPSFNDLFGTLFLKTFVVLAQKEFRISFHVSNSDQRLENQLIEDLLVEDIEGLVLIPSFSNTVSSTVLQLISKDFPIIVVDRSLNDLPVCSVMTNNKKSTEILTNVLFQQGHKLIAMITTKRPLSSISERTEGFINAHMQASISLGKDSILSLDDKNDLKSHIHDIKIFLEKHSEITGIVCEEYYLAYCVQIAIEEMNMTIPNDLSVVCFDHPSMASFENRSNALTYIKQDEIQLAEETFKMLKYKFAHGKDFKKAFVDGKLILGSSVRSIK